MGERGDGGFMPEGGESDLRGLLGEEGARWFLQSEEYAAAEAAWEEAADATEFLDSPVFTEGFGAFLAAMLAKAEREKPAEFAAAARALDADGRADEFARRYREEGVRISYDEAVELARGLMCMRTPYFRGKGRTRPVDRLPYIYDYEILAAKALKDGSLLEELIERSEREKLAWDALQECVRGKRQGQKPVEGELLEWALDVADGTRPRPHWGRNQTTEIRDTLIVETVEALVACGLTKTRRHGAEPRSACDAVAKVLGMTYQAVRKVSDRTDRGTKVRLLGPTTG